MNQAQLKKVVGKYCHAIKKLNKKIPNAFDVEDIHDLRVAYKKLRAFVRLLKTEPKANGLKIPVDLTSVYKAAGAVRDLQLLIILLEPYFKEKDFKQYLLYLEQQLLKEKENLVRAAKQISLEKTENAFVKQLPGNLYQVTIYKFVYSKIAAVHLCLQAPEKDENLHTIRKHLKDVLYNKRITEADLHIRFPDLGINEKELNDATTLLGKYNDLCFGLSSVEPGLMTAVPQEEKEILESLQNAWKEEKNALLRVVTDQVKQLELISVQRS